MMIAEVMYSLCIAGASANVEQSMLCTVVGEGEVYAEIKRYTVTEVKRCRGGDAMCRCGAEVQIWRWLVGYNRRCCSAEWHLVMKFSRGECAGDSIGAEQVIL